VLGVVELKSGHDETHMLRYRVVILLLEDLYEFFRVTPQDELSYLLIAQVCRTINLSAETFNISKLARVLLIHRWFDKAKIGTYILKHTEAFYVG
jgi:hypothetical protein